MFGIAVLVLMVKQVQVVAWPVAGLVATMRMLSPGRCSCLQRLSKGGVSQLLHSWPLPHVASATVSASRSATDNHLLIIRAL
jgi:hypothetical protein